jgi:hypothetical protein
MLVATFASVPTQKLGPEQPGKGCIYFYLYNVHELPQDVTGLESLTLHVQEPLHKQTFTNPGTIKKLG